MGTDELICLARRDEDQEAPDNRKTVLYTALNGKCCELFSDYPTGTTAWAADGILDVGELHAMAVLAGKLISRINQNLTAAQHFVYPGTPVATVGGMVAVCNSENGVCAVANFELCKKCAKGKGRVVPADFYSAAVGNSASALRHTYAVPLRDKQAKGVQ